jgi:hypothetical protein
VRQTAKWMDEWVKCFTQFIQRLHQVY